MGDDERLLSGLGEAAREGDPLADPRWEALSAGQLSAAEEKALSALAKESGRSEDLVDAFRYSGMEAEDKLVERVMGALESRARDVAEAAVPPPPIAMKGGAQEDPRELRAPGLGWRSRGHGLYAEASGMAMEGEELENVAEAAVPPPPIAVKGGAQEDPREPRAPGLRSRGRGRALYAAASAIAAAAMILWFFFRPPELLPGYTMDVTGGERSQRSDNEPRYTIERFGHGSRLEITLTPAEPVSGEVDARAFLVRDGRARAFNVPVKIAQGGAVRVVGATDDLFAGVAPGPWEVVVAVGRPGKLPDETTVVASGTREGAPFQLLRREILLTKTQLP